MTKLAHVIAALLGCSIPALAFASPPGIEKSVDDMLREAALVVEGKVIEVSYGMSVPTADRPEPMPHTFVTFELLGVEKGTAPAQRLTLRFLGGPINNDMFLRLPSVPLFDVGDHDMLLVVDNERSECPLVDCARGRFRFVEGIVVNEYGERLQLDGSTVTTGRAVKLDAVDRHNMSRFALERVEADEQGHDNRQSLSEAKQERVPGRDPTPQEMASHVRARIAAIHTEAELAQARAHVEPSADPRRPFEAWFVRGTPEALDTPDPALAATTDTNREPSATPGAASERQPPSAAPGRSTHQVPVQETVDEVATPTAPRRRSQAPVEIGLGGLALGLLWLSYRAWPRARGSER